MGAGSGGGGGGIIIALIIGLVLLLLLGAALWYRRRKPKQKHPHVVQGARLWCSSSKFGRLSIKFGSKKLDAKGGGLPHVGAAESGPPPLDRGVSYVAPYMANLFGRQTGKYEGGPGSPLSSPSSGAGAAAAKKKVSLVTHNVHDAFTDVERPSLAGNLSKRLSKKVSISGSGKDRTSYQSADGAGDRGSSKGLISMWL